MLKKYTATIYTCYIGYVVQAIINNLAPLLFLTFQRSFNISTEQIGLLISINFGVQILVDFVAAKYVDKIGYRASMIIAHVCSVIGLIGLGTFPFLMSPYAGLILAMVCNAIGGGLIEVLVSPIVEAAPSSNAKEAAMSLLHSFYCWGHVAVVLLSTLGFRLLGMDRWYLLPIIWSIVPACNCFLFSQVPIRTLVEEDEQIPARKLLSMKMFWLFFALMVCAGASEQAMSQWASLFAEEGLKQSKTVGDLLGPCFFAVLMGSSRAFYGKYGERINLRKFMLASGVLCIISYLLAILMANPLWSVCRYYVARNIQPLCQILPPGRNTYVCPVSSCGRSGLCLRTFCRKPRVRNLSSIWNQGRTRCSHIISYANDSPDNMESKKISSSLPELKR